MSTEKITTGVLSISILYEFLKQQYSLLPVEIRCAMIEAKEFCDDLQTNDIDYEELPFMVERPHIVREEEGQADVIKQWNEALCPNDVYKQHFPA